MLEKTLLLTDDESSSDDDRAARMLDFFGVSYERRKTTDSRLTESRFASNNRKYRVLCAAHTFARVINENGTVANIVERLSRILHSVFVYPGGNPAALSELVGKLGGNDISVRRGAATRVDWEVADDSTGVCAAMGGLRVRPESTTLSGCYFFEGDGGSASPLIASGNKAAFLKLTFSDIPVFVSSVSLIDIDADLATRNFDVRDHFFSAVPMVSYIRWAFPHSAWRAPEASACLVIDDPLLKARYGFVRFRELLALMKHLRFSTSVAFIPWNWQRSDPKVVQLFKDNSEYYSLCVHGCDHTAAEFACADRLRLGAVASEAVRRMSLHEQRTGLAHDRIMVFPQGIFSGEAISELKRAGFDAAVNTEVHSNSSGGHKLRIADVWDVAVMTYGDFPIYTRRYPAQGIENLAFDLLLGKPCLAVIHHDFCRDAYQELTAFIKQLNELKVPLVWRRLSDLVRRSYRQKETEPDLVEIEMYGNPLLIENTSTRIKRYLIRRREHNPDTIESINIGSQHISWEPVGDHIELKLELRPGESKSLTLCFKSVEHVAYGRQSFARGVKTMLRRYLSEARDNYLVPVKARMMALPRS